MCVCSVIRQHREPVWYAAAADLKLVASLTCVFTVVEKEELSPQTCALLSLLNWLRFMKSEGQSTVCSHQPDLMLLKHLAIHTTNECCAGAIATRQ